MSSDEDLHSHWLRSHLCQSPCVTRTSRQKNQRAHDTGSVDLTSERAASRRCLHLAQAKNAKVKSKSRFSQITSQTSRKMLTRGLTNLQKAAKRLANRDPFASEPRSRTHLERPDGKLAATISAAANEKLLSSPCQSAGSRSASFRQTSPP